MQKHDTGLKIELKRLVESQKYAVLGCFSSLSQPFKCDYLLITILRNAKLIHKGIMDNENTFFVLIKP